jgi:hypothetical protein
VTFGYVLLNVFTSACHSFSSAALAAGGMQSIVSVTFVFGSSGADASVEPPPPELSPPPLLLVPQAATVGRASAETRTAAAERRGGRNQELLIGGPLRA